MCKKTQLSKHFGRLALMHYLVVGTYIIDMHYLVLKTQWQVSETDKKSYRSHQKSFSWKFW